MRRPGAPVQDRLFITVSICLAVLWAAVIAVQHLDGRKSVLDRAEALFTDLRFLLVGPRKPPAEVVIVAIDDAAVADAGAYPLPRRTIARLVEALAAYDPKVIALDLLFLENGPPEDDRALAERLKGSRSVIAAAGLFARGPAPEPPADVPHAVPFVDRVLWPVPHLRDAASVGLVNVAADASGTPRHIPLILQSREAVLPSFVLRVASVAAAADPVLDGDRVTVGARSVSTDLGHHLPLNFYGPRSSVATVGAGAVLSGRADPGQLRGRIILVGATAVASGDTFANPFDAALPGVEVLATAVAHLVAGDNLVRDRRVRRFDAAAALVLPVATILLLSTPRIGVGFALMGLGGALWAGLSWWAFRHGLWLSATVPLAATLPAAGAYGAARLWLDRSRAGALAELQQTFRRFHPPALAKRLATDPHYLAEPVQQNAAVLFIDLSRFTGLSERLGPDATRDLLKEFHSRIEQEVTREEGVVLSFMGDGAMIVFGLPDPHAEDPCRAVRAAVGLSDGITAWLEDLPQPLRASLGVRIGAHYGPVVVSRMGADSHQHITAIGDTVNVASRLLDVAARGEAAIAVSEELVQAAGDACSAFERGTLGASTPVDIRGRVSPLKVHLWKR